MVSNDRKKKVIVYGGSIIAIGIVFLLVYFFSAKKGAPPHSLGALTHLHTLQNDEARALCLAMYTPRNDVKKYVVWKYGSPQGFSTIYCFTFAKQSIAQSELDSIVVMIDKGTIPSSHLRTFEYGGKKVYLFLAKGRANYLVLDAETFYWIEADVPIAQKTVASFIDYLKD